MQGTVVVFFFHLCIMQFLDFLDLIIKKENPVNNKQIRVIISNKQKNGINFLALILVMHFLHFYALMAPAALMTAASRPSPSFTPPTHTHTPSPPFSLLPISVWPCTVFVARVQHAGSLNPSP
jgi:hypothetical protein